MGHASSAPNKLAAAKCWHLLSRHLQHKTQHAACGCNEFNVESRRERQRQHVGDGGGRTRLARFLVNFNLLQQVTMQTRTNEWMRMRMRLWLQMWMWMGKCRVATLSLGSVPKLGQAQSADDCDKSKLPSRSGNFDRLFNWLRCLPPVHGNVSAPAPAPVTATATAPCNWSDVDKAQARHRRRLNCRTFYRRSIGGSRSRRLSTQDLRPKARVQYDDAAPTSRSTMRLRTELPVIIVLCYVIWPREVTIPMPPKPTTGHLHTTKDFRPQFGDN